MQLPFFQIEKIASCIDKNIMGASSCPSQDQCIIVEKKMGRSLIRHKSILPEQLNMYEGRVSRKTSLPGFKKVFILKIWFPQYWVSLFLYPVIFPGVGLLFPGRPKVKDPKTKKDFCGIPTTSIAFVMKIWKKNKSHCDIRELFWKKTQTAFISHTRHRYEKVRKSNKVTFKSCA